MPSNPRKKYQSEGYVLIESFLEEFEIAMLEDVVTRFHERWIVDNESFYQKQAINSAYLTGTKYLEQHDRTKLFEFLASRKMMDVILTMPIAEPAFMNTQLFFDPVSPELKNYWHRDGQYHLSIEEQKQALQGPVMLHFRIALKDEAGIELIPGSHKRWDSEEELNTRLEKSGRRSFDDLSTGHSVPLNKGDLLIFSANMIHRGLYGNNRMALDILYCEAQAEFFKFADPDCLPDKTVIEKLECPNLMLNALRIMSSVGQH